MDNHDHSSDEAGASDEHSHHEHRKTTEDESAGEADESRVEQSMLEDEAEDAGDAEQAIEEKHEHHMDHGEGDHEHSGGHDGHGGMHEGHEQMFRRRFFVSTILSIPVLLYSPTLQE